MKLPLVVSGTRRVLSVRDKKTLQQDLDDAKEYRIIHVGDCPTGVDAFVWALRHEPGYEVVQHTANWDEHGKAAGPLRNRDMLLAAKANPGLLLAYPHREQHRGTLDCIEQAIRLGYDICVTTLEGVE